MRSLFLAVAAIAAVSLGSVDVASAAKCQSIQAKCAIEAGGKCDPQTGRWCYGFYRSENCGGRYSAFIACLDRERAAVRK